MVTEDLPDQLYADTFFERLNEKYTNQLILISVFGHVCNCANMAKLI